MFNSWKLNEIVDNKKSDREMRFQSKKIMHFQCKSGFSDSFPQFSNWLSQRDGAIFYAISNSYWIEQTLFTLHKLYIVYLHQLDSFFRAQGAGVWLPVTDCWIFSSSKNCQAWSAKMQDSTKCSAAIGQNVHAFLGKQKMEQCSQSQFFQEARKAQVCSI